MGRSGHRAGLWRGVFLTLAVLVLALKVLVPTGYMVADTGGGLALTICTGHGPLIVRHGDPKAPAQRTSDAPCAFAGAMTPITPTAPTLVAARPAFAMVTAASPLRPDLSPGRGLAAPPPPAVGPPILSA